MQLHRDYLGVGDLVPARPGLPFWASGTGMGSGGCGIGDLVPSNPGLPFWPSGAGMGDLVSSAPGRPFWPSGSGMGDQVSTSAMYPIAQNSVLEYTGLSGCGCGCGGGCGHSHGLGALTDDFSAMFTNLGSGNFSAAWSSFMSAMQEPVFGTVPFWMVGGGALLIYSFVFSGGSKHSRYSRGRRALSSARAAYA